MSFSGSYLPGDVTFLLKRVIMQETDVATKEAAIQSGARHYSEMLSPEKSPGPAYIQLFERAVELNGPKLARDIARLTRTLAARPGRQVVVVSLARAGTPVGVLLRRGLAHIGRACKHYSVSIIRDRGVDAVALKHIVDRHADTDIVFVDGWTGKGVISAELAKSVTAFNAEHGTNVSGELAVVADLAGAASLAVTSEDYLIPHAVLNSTVSGLISRTVLNSNYVGPGDFHACVFYAEKGHEDRSRWYVDTLTPHMVTALDDASASQPCSWSAEMRSSLRATSDDFVAGAMEGHNVNHRNHVKPGIGETTRALLRRVPDCLIVKDSTAPDVAHLVALATEKRVPVVTDPALAYRAAAIIQSLGD